MRLKKKKLMKEQEVNLKKVLDTYFTTSGKSEKSQDDCDLSGKSIYNTNQSEFSCNPVLEYCI